MSYQKNYSLVTYHNCPRSPNLEMHITLQQHSIQISLMIYTRKHSIQIINIWQNFITKRLFCLDHITRLLRHKGIFSPRSITWLHHKTKRVYKTKQLHLFFSFFLRVDSSYTQPVTRIFYNQGQLPEERQTIRQDPNLEICLGNWAYSLVSE